MLNRLRHILEMIRFSHTLFALPFALLSAALAWRLDVREDVLSAGRFGQELAGIVLCMVFARSAAMAFNRLADRQLDAENPRTAGRHLPRGVLSARAVTAFCVAAAAGFVLATLLFLPNRWPLYLAVPVLAFLLGYSYTKRFTVLSHFWLGASLMLAPIAAWIAIRGDAATGFPIAWPPVLLGGAVLFWVAGFDMLYACQDVDFDRRRGLKSIPAKLGVRPALLVAAGCHLVTVALLFALWHVAGLGWIFFAGVAAVAALLIYEHLLVKPDDLTRVNVAFFHVNSIISVGLLAVALVDLAV